MKNRIPTFDEFINKSKSNQNIPVWLQLIKTKPGDEIEIMKMNNKTVSGRFVAFEKNTIILNNDEINIKDIYVIHNLTWNKSM